MSKHPLILSSPRRGISKGANAVIGVNLDRKAFGDHGSMPTILASRTVVTME